MIRPFKIGDLVLVQRLHRQATKLNILQALLEPQATTWLALHTLKPWSDNRQSTYVLRQTGHMLARAGMLQAEQRGANGNGEARLVQVAPALDTPRGHPAVWEKLLAHYLHDAAQRGVVRVFADVPDQPLPVTTLAHVGFHVYQRMAIWRLTAQDAGEFLEPALFTMRPQKREDEWALLRLYSRITPKAVQLAEGVIGSAVPAPILGGWYHGDVRGYVLLDKDDVAGCVQVAVGRLGVWMQVWCDYSRPDSVYLRQLVRQGLIAARRSGLRQPLYVGVAEHQGGLPSVLADFGFAPFTDRACMVRPLAQRVVEKEPQRVTVREVMPEPVVSFRAWDEADGRNMHSAEDVYRVSHSSPQPQRSGVA